MKLILKNSTVKIDNRIKEMKKDMKEALNWVNDDIKFYQSEANEFKAEIENLKRMQQQGIKEVNV